MGKFFIATELLGLRVNLPVSIIIGGPANSGKSTLAESLARALRRLGVDAFAEDLDLASPTLEFIRGTKGWEQRLSSKKEWTPQLAEKAASLFEKASAKHAVVIGEAPGKITDISKRIAQKADYAIILCRDDHRGEMANWQGFFDQLGVPVICVAVSKLTGTGSIEPGEVIRATLTGLNRTPKTDETIVNLAMLIKEKLSL